MKRICGCLPTALLTFGLLLVGPQTSKSEPTNTGFTPVLELFTSQGCSSCPPADKYLGELQGRADLVALTLPVDYWDYLGWKDTLARPENSVRQRLYAKMRKGGAVYTPQIVVNGVSHAVGSRPGEVANAIAQAKAKLEKRSVPVQLTMQNGDLVVDMSTGAKPAKRAATIWLALVSKMKQVKISRGENHGRTVSYYNVVRSMKKVGTWDGQASRLTVKGSELSNADSESCAILIQEGSAGPILGAAIMRSIGS